MALVLKTQQRQFKKIERVFAAEPEFNFKAALLGVPNARTGKPFTHDTFGVTEKLPPREPGTSRATLIVDSTDASTPEE